MSRVWLVVLLAALAVAGWWVQQRAEEQRRAAAAGRPRVEGRIAVPGARAPLRILRDARGIPHVEALSERDAYFGLGFAHAQDRLGQMLDLLRTARGTTAELVGEAGLPVDRLARVLDVPTLARRQLEASDPRTRALLEAYAAGVNARLARLRAGLAAPPPLHGADPLPEGWHPADAIAVLKIWAWGLGNSYETSLVLDDLLQHLGAERARPFFPAGAGVAKLREQGPPALVDAGAGTRDPVRPGVQALRLGSGSRDLVRPGVQALRLGSGSRDPVRSLLGMRAPGLGSSAWVVAGRRTVHGKPLLAADSHLEPTVPALFYLAHLRGGELDAAGATLPGVPVLWSGANGRVAWAATAARASVIDLFVESVSRPEGRPARVHDGRRWRPLEQREEEIAIRGGRVERLRVEVTPHGPLIDPLLEHAREPLALAWSGARPGDGIGPLLRAARAADGDAFEAELAGHHEPVLAYVWADDGGAAGRRVAGWLPRRALPSGLVPVSGRSGWAAWQGGLPPERLPATRLAPGTDFLIASDGPLEDGARRTIEWLWRRGAREARLTELLAGATEPISLRQMVAWQDDRRSAGAEQVLGPALALAGTPAQLPAEEREIRALLAAWDGDTGSDSVAAAVYHVFLDSLIPAVLEPVLGSALFERYLALTYANPVPLLGRVLAAAESGWRAEGGRGARLEAPAAWTRRRVAAAVRDALRRTWLRFGVEVGPNRDRWRWGLLHELRFEPFGLLRFAGRVEPELGPLPHPGDASTVVAGGYDWNEPFAVTSASTFRMAVDLADRTTWFVSLAPGQAEQPAHPHRADGVADWRAGQPGVMLMSPILLEEQAEDRLSLVPEEPS